ncbi:MAG: hypothetical protein ABI776_11570 [Nocardioidaceae bacterium]
MISRSHGTPDLMPVLSRGKHRNPKRGACFMELASYLAGEPWSDHPSCTHGLLASLARDVNDHVGDHARNRLAPRIPEVIGLNGPDPRVDAWIAREAALAALPVTAAERQGVAAVGLLRCERMLNQLEGRDRHHLDARTVAALDGVPHARDWARGFTAIGWGNTSSFAKRSAPAIVHSAVSGIAAASVSHSDDLLVELLESTISLCREWFHHDVHPLTDAAWHELGQLTARS